MSSRSHNEYHRVELPFIEQLKHMDWQHIEGDVAVPEFTERTSFRESDVLLEGRLAQALRRINVDEQGNTWLTDQHMRQAISDLHRVSAVSLLEANEKAMDLLLRGTLVEGDATLHSGKNATVHYIDYINPLNNDFLAINQFRVNPYGAQGNKGYIVPDIVLFVNGIPLVVVECKSPYLDEAATPMENGINDLLLYSNQRDELEENTGAERLFYTNLLMISTYFDEARFGTITARHQHYFEWKDTYPLTEAELAETLGLRVEQLTSQHRLVAGMLRPQNLIDILANFVIFKTDGSKQLKVVARYQQFRAVQNAVHRLEYGQTRIQHGKDDQRGGIIWHTQGSGKSLTMVFLIRKMRRIEKLKSFKIVIVTDRTDLQDQLSETATLSGETVRTAKSSRTLKTALQRKTPDIIFAMIQKYRGGEGISQSDNELYPELNDSENILILVDEAHRSHSNTMHANLRRALKNAAQIGLTGTPIIMGKRKETAEIFGPFIDVYTIDQSVEDGATVRIVYEGRTAEGIITEESVLNRKFEDMFVDRTPEELEAIKQKYATKGNLLEAVNLINAKAENILYHYIDTVLPNHMKAMVVASSRKAAVRYQEALDKAHRQLIQQLQSLPQNVLALSNEELQNQDELTRLLVRAYPHLSLIERLEFAAVVSSAKGDPTSWERWSDRTQIDQNIENFKKALVHKDEHKQHGLAFLCVKSMLLTGFDAPVAQVLYLDRSIQEHELLQAIARVNRTYAQKSRGLVVDYFGVARHLNEALEAYRKDDIQGAMLDIDQELPILRDRHHRVIEIFNRSGIKSIYDEEECLYLLSDTRIRAEFTVKLRLFFDSLDIVMPRPEALPYLADARQLGYIRIRARNRYRDGQLNIAGLEGKVKQLIDEHVIAKGIDSRIPPIDIMDVEAFSRVLSMVESNRAKASEMEHAARYHINRRMPEDPVYYRKLSEQLNAILQQYNEQWEALVAALAEFTEKLQRGRKMDETGLDPSTQAPFMRLLIDEIYGEVAIPVSERDHLAHITVDMVNRIRQSIKVIDFWRRPTEQKRLRLKIYEFLRENEIIEDGKLENVVDKLMEIAKWNDVALRT